MASPRWKSEMLAGQRSRKAEVARMLNDLEDDESPELKAEMLVLQKAISDFDDYLSTKIEAVYYNEHRKFDSVAAQRVFDIPEMLECILEKLQIPDIMRCYGACRTMRDGINTSRKLKVKLGLIPAPEGSAMRCPSNPFGLPNCDFVCCKRPFSSTHGATFGAMETLSGSTTLLPRIGSRWKQMFVRQPPIHSMRVSLQYFPKELGQFLDESCDTHSGHIDVKSHAGITVGDLFEAAENLLQKYGSGPCEHESGERTMWVFFEGPLEDS